MFISLRSKQENEKREKNLLLSASHVFGFAFCDLVREVIYLSSIEC